jgi:hypothetical protein
MWRRGSRGDDDLVAEAIGATAVAATGEQLVHARGVAMAVRVARRL